MKTFIATLKKTNLRYRSVMLFYILATTAAAAGVVLMNRLSGEMSEAALLEDVDRLLWLLLLVTGVMVVRVIAAALSALLLARFSAGTGYALRANFVRHFLRVPFARIEQAPGGENLSLYSNDIPKAERFIASGIFELAADFISFVSAFMFLLIISPRFTGIAFIAAVGMLIVQILIALPLQRWAVRMSEKKAAFTAVVNDSLQNLSTVAAYNLEEIVEARYMVVYRQYYAAIKKFALSLAFMVGSMMAIMMSPLIVIFTVLALAVIGGDLSLAEFVAFVTTVMVAAGAVMQLSQNVGRLAEASAGAKRLNQKTADAHELCENQPQREAGVSELYENQLQREADTPELYEIQPQQGAVAPELYENQPQQGADTPELYENQPLKEAVLPGAIVFNNVTFTYGAENKDEPPPPPAKPKRGFSIKISSGTPPEETPEPEPTPAATEKAPSTPALDGVSFTIRPGSRVAIVGTSGSGKSTILKLLLGLYEPSSGEITMDGQDISQLPKARLRDAFSYVPQDSFLFPESIGRNISLAFNGAQADTERLQQACRQADILDFINTLPDRFDGILTEAADNVSGGQRQRIAMARAFYKNAPVILFDEATASLDTATEAAILATFGTAAQNKTVIMVAHRPQAIAACDTIIVMAAGKIAGIGSHAELLLTNETYQQLNRQEEPS